MARYRVAVIGGDGIGPEVVREGVKVVTAASEKAGLSLDWVELPYGADRYLATGVTLTDEELEGLKDYSAVYFGAMGDLRVKPGILERGLILRIRFGLDEYVNLRPVKLYEGVSTPLAGKGPKDIDFCVVRENTEDFYVGLGARVNGPGRHSLEVPSGPGRGTRYDMDISGVSDDQAFQIGVVTRRGCRRIIAYAFDLARRLGRTRVTSVDKANVLTEAYGLWREVFEEVARGYQAIETEYAFVDAITMWFVKNPEHYQVVVTPNMFGDIITDLGAMIQGGLGFAPGGNINPEGVSMFEPIHGSAPKYKGLNVANPIASILAAEMMLEELARKHSDKDAAYAAGLVEKGVSAMLAEGKIRTRDMGGSSRTTDVGDGIVEKIDQL